MALRVKLLPKLVTCPHCDEEVYRGDYCYKLSGPQVDAQRALNTHLIKCTVASEMIKGAVRKARGESGANIASSNCVCCGKVSRADKIVPHIMSKHDMRTLVTSMPKQERREALKSEIPIVRCYKDDKLLFRACLHCKKGFLATCHGKGDAVIAVDKRSGKHSECVKHFDDYKYLFEMEEPQTDLPFHLYNCEDPENPTKRNYITLEHGEPGRKPYVRVDERRAIAKEAKEMASVPINEIVLENDAEYESLRKRVESLERENESLERDLKTAKAKKEPMGPPMDAKWLSLLRKIAGDDNEEYDMDDLFEECEKALERSANLEEVVTKRYEKTLARERLAMAKLRAELEEKEKYIEVMGTVGFTRGGRRLEASESDSD